MIIGDACHRLVCGEGLGSSSRRLACSCVGGCVSLSVCRLIVSFGISMIRWRSCIYFLPFVVCCVFFSCSLTLFFLMIINIIFSFHVFSSFSSPLPPLYSSSPRSLLYFIFFLFIITSHVFYLNHIFTRTCRSPRKK